MNNKIYLLFDINSTEMNSALYKEQKLEYIYFKKVSWDYSLDNVYGISNENVKILLEFFRDVNKEKHISCTSIRVYASGIFRKLDNIQTAQLRRKIYIELGIDFYIISEELELFYKNKISNLAYSKTILDAVVIQEFRSVVLCGSFRKHLDIVKQVNDYCLNHNVKVLSPQSLCLEDVYNGKFVLFHGEKISNERETFRIESQHTEAIVVADAVIICNFEGYVGTTTIFEIGFAVAHNKKIVFLDCNTGNLDISFPRNYGLL